MNGYKNWNDWNVALWIDNDEDLYHDAYGKVTMLGASQATKEMMAYLKGKRTPDGARYTHKSLYGALSRLEM